MPAGELSAYGGPERERGGYAGPVAAAALSALGMFVAVWPLSAVVQPGAWSAGAVAVAGSVILTALVVRTLTRRGPAWLTLPVVPLLQLVAGSIALAVFTSKQVGRGGLLPTPDVIGRIDALIPAAAEEIRSGVAPLASTPAVAVAVAVATGMLALVLDLVLVALRTPLVAAVLLAVARGGAVDRGARQAEPRVVPRARRRDRAVPACAVRPAGIRPRGCGPARCTARALPLGHDLPRWARAPSSPPSWSPRCCRSRPRASARAEARRR